MTKMTKWCWSAEWCWSESSGRSDGMAQWCRVGLVLWCVMASTVAAQERAAPDLERAAAEEVRRREAVGSLRQDGTSPGSEQRPRTVIVHTVIVHTDIVHEERRPERQRELGLDAVARSVNGELTDVARAFRRLDQSYAVRGFQGCAAATAGSVFVDWRAKGVRPQDRYAVLPPEPIVLGRPKAAVCSPVCGHCGRAHFGEGGIARGCPPTAIDVRPYQPDPSTLPAQLGRPCCNGIALPIPPLQLTPTPIEATHFADEIRPTPAP